MLFLKAYQVLKNIAIVHLCHEKVHPDQYLVLDHGQQVQDEDKLMVIQLKTVTADLTQLMQSSKQGSVSLGEMLKAQQARCVSPSNSRKALCKYSVWEGCLYMAHVTVVTALSLV